MARKTKMASAETRQNIINSAIFEFAKNGFYNASLANISKRAGVTRGAFYFHFSNKLDVFDHIWRETVNVINEIEYGSLQKYPENPILVSKDIIKQHLHLIESSPFYRLKIKIIFQTQNDSREMQPYFLAKADLSFVNTHWLEKQFIHNSRMKIWRSDADISVIIALLNVYFIGMINCHFLESDLANIQVSEQCIDFLIDKVINMN